MEQPVKLTDEQKALQYYVDQGKMCARCAKKIARDTKWEGIKFVNGGSYPSEPGTCSVCNEPAEVRWFVPPQ